MVEIVEMVQASSRLQVDREALQLKSWNPVSAGVPHSQLWLLEKCSLFYNNTKDRISRETQNFPERFLFFFFFFLPEDPATGIFFNDQ